MTDNTLIFDADMTQLSAVRASGFEAIWRVQGDNGSMKHASQAALAALAPLLESLRGMDGLRERTPGCFYRGSHAFLHFHEDPTGLFADVRLNGAGFHRLSVDTGPQREALLHVIKAALSGSG
jgi:hypothetical protein